MRLGSPGKETTITRNENEGLEQFPGDIAMCFGSFSLDVEMLRWGYSRGWLNIYPLRGGDVVRHLDILLPLRGTEHQKKCLECNPYNDHHMQGKRHATDVLRTIVFNA